MNRRVEGIYTTVEEAMNAVHRLRNEGYSRNEIFLVANADVRNNIPYTMDAEISTDNDATATTTTTGTTDVGDDDRSLWEKIKGAFTVDDNYDASVYDDPNHDTDNDPLFTHRDDLDRGNIIVMVDADATPRTGMADTTGAMGTGVNDITGTDRTDDTINTRDRFADTDLDRDETIELREENLDVDTREVQTGEVRVGKRVVEETETIDVPVTHEEVTIERRPVTDRRRVDGDLDIDLNDEEIVIPVTEEQVQIDKHAEVVEEVDINKEQVTENKRVTETVRREELDVDTTGNIRVDDNQTHHDRDHGVLDTDRDTLDTDRTPGTLDTDRDILDTDRTPGTLDTDRDILDTDRTPGTLDTDRDILDGDADRRTMDTDRGLFDNDPDRDRRI